MVYIRACRLLNLTMAVSARLMLLFLVCFTPIAHPVITRLQSSTELTQRNLACPGETVTLSCTSNGTEIFWESDPSLRTDNRSILCMCTGCTCGFVHSDTVGTNCGCLQNYTNGTAFFVSAVLTNSPVMLGDDWNSSITFVPIPNNEGLFPTSFINNSLTIICGTGSREPGADPGMQWEYRVAAVPGLVNATCTNILSHKIVQIEIEQQNNSSVEIRHYEISILDGTKIKVLAQSDGERVAVFYPVNDPVTTAQIVAVDMCNQQSDSTTIRCAASTPEPPPTCNCSTDSGAAGGINILTPLLSVIIGLIIILFFRYLAYNVMTLY